MEKLAQNKSFQAFAVKTVDSFQEVQKKAEELGKKAAEDPEQVKEAVKEQANTFWNALKSEVARDLEKFTSQLNDAPHNAKVAKGEKPDDKLR